MKFKIRKGLDLPVTGEPEQRIYASPEITRVALLGREYIGMKPSMQVQEGDRVKLGETLFTDKKNPRVRYVAPGSGVVESIHRGAKRVFQALIIRLDGDEETTFPTHAAEQLLSLRRETIVEQLLESGLWVAFRTRPYSKSPEPEQLPHSIFVTATDSRPLAANPEAIIAGYADDYANGLKILTRLTTGSVYVCGGEQQASTTQLEGLSDQIQCAQFSGPHPAGIPGTHIHLLDPVHSKKTVWHISYQEVIAMGKLFTEGRIWTDRIISLAGPAVKNPRLVRVRLGANTDDIVDDELVPGECRVISGSIFAGWRAAGWASYLGRFSQQISVLHEGREREFMGWIMPGRDKFSKTNALLSSFARRALRFPFGTSQNGSERAMVPIGVYESVVPLDILPTQLLRALSIQDTDMAQALGCLELDEEDLALCTFVCPSKYEFGPMLRDNLTLIEKDG